MCGESEFKCKDEKACVLRDVRCDGNDDCGDGSDEDPLLCSKRCYRGNKPNSCIV